jgi:hypothetical protein
VLYQQMREYARRHLLPGTRNVIGKYYGRSILALLLIPLAVISAAAILDAIDPEIARSHGDYARNKAVLAHWRHGVLLAESVLLGALWPLACVWLLRGTE